MAAWMTLVIFWAGAIFALVYLRSAAFATAETHLGNLTRVIAAETEAVLNSVESVLLDLREAAEKTDTFDPAQVEWLLRAHSERVPFLRSVTVVDDENRLLFLNTQSHRDDAFTGVGGGWFMTQREHRTRSLVISPPIRTQAEGEWTIPLSLRIEGNDRRFRGVVVAALDSNFFRAMFKDLDLGQNSSITLARQDNVVLLHEPVVDKLTGTTLPPTAINQAIRTANSAVVRSTSIVSHEPTLFAARKVEGFPLYVVIGLAESTIVKTWRAQAAFILGTVTVLSVLLFTIMRQSDIAARLDAKNQAVRALVDASPRPLATLRRTEENNFVVEWANDPFAELMGENRKGIIDSPLSGLLAKCGRDAEPFVIDENRGSSINGVIEGPQGPIETQLLFTPVHGGSHAVGTILVTALDLGARRVAARKEAERHLLEALGRMAGRIAHEINNVLQPIMSHSSLALHSCYDDETADHIREIQNGVRNGRDIVRSVLSLAGGKTVLRNARLVDQEIVAAVELIKPSVPHRISLETSLNAVGLATALAPGDIFQILSNLVVNAVDAVSSAGTIRIEATRRTIDLSESDNLGLAAGLFVQILVADTGCGMDQETASRALDPFFTTKPFGKGVGLGLSTVQTLVDTLQGVIILSSEPGKGTLVRVLLPVQEGL